MLSINVILQPAIDAAMVTRVITDSGQQYILQHAWGIEGMGVVAGSAHTHTTPYPPQY